MTQGFNLGNAHGSVTISTEGVRAAMQQAQNIFRDGLSAIGANMQAWGDQIASIGSNLTVLTAPFTAFAATGVRTAANFDATLTEIQARTGLTVDQMGRIRDTAIQLGADTVFSSQQAAEAFLQLITAGLSLEDAMALLPTVLDAAAASGESLGQTADVVTNIISSFGLSADQAINVVEAMSRAAASSPASMGQMGEAMAAAGGTASAFGVSMEDTAAIMAIFAQQGIRGAEAGTQFRSMVRNMYRPTEDVRGAWERLGVSLFDSEGRFRDINDVLVEANAALSLLPESEASEIITTIAGGYGMVGFNALRAGTSIAEMQDRMAGQASATDVAAARMGAFNGVIDSLRGSFETLQIEVMTPFMNDVLRPLAQHLTIIINRITEWVQANPELVSQILRVMSVLAALGPTLFAGGRMISAVGGLLTGLTSPIGMLIAAGAALYAAWETNFLGIRDFLEPVLAWLRDALQLFITGDFVGGMFGGAMEDSPIVSMILRIREVFETVFTDILNFIQSYVVPLFETFVTWFTQELLPAIGDVLVNQVFPVVESFFNFLAEAWEIVRPALENLARWFLEDALPAVMDFISGTVVPAIGEFIGFLAGIWEAVAPALLALLDWFINTGLPAIAGFIEQVWNDIILPFFNFLAAVWEQVAPALSSLFNWFVTEAWPQIRTVIEEVWRNIIEPAFGFLASVWEGVAPALQSLYSWFIESGLPAIRGVVEFFWHNLLEPVINLLRGIWDAVSPGVKALAEGFLAALGEVIRIAGEALRIIGEVIDRLGGIQQSAQQAGRDIAAGIQSGQISADQLTAGNMMSATTTAMEQEGGIWSLAAGAMRAFGIGRDMGGRGEAGQAYAIGTGAQPEVFIPDSAGTFIPNIDQVLAGAGGQQIVFEPGSVVIQANNPAEVEGAADMFVRRVREEWEARG